MTDSLHFLDAVAGLPEQLAAAHETAASIPASALPSAEPIRNIAVLGMGGSGIAGDVIATTLNDELPVPVNVLKQIRTPAYVGPNTLAFAMSYSGDTEETVSMARGAVEQGAQLVAVSCGGELERLAREAGALHVPCPGGYLPRAAIGALGAVAAYRWKCDVNENAKAPAFWNAYPELAHNEICAWGQHGDVTRQLLTLVELRHGYEHDRLKLRFAAGREQIDECVHQILTVEAQGEGRLAQLLDLMYVGDWASCYLALQNDVDPGPIDAIATLKARVADG